MTPQQVQREYEYVTQRVQSILDQGNAERLVGAELITTPAIDGFFAVKEIQQPVLDSNPDSQLYFQGSKARVSPQTLQAIRAGSAPIGAALVVFCDRYRALAEAADYWHGVTKPVIKVRWEVTATEAQWRVEIRCLFFGLRKVPMTRSEQLDQSTDQLKKAAAAWTPAAAEQKETEQ